MLQVLRALGPSGLEEEVMLGNCEIAKGSPSSVYKEWRLLGGRERTKVDKVREASWCAQGSTDWGAWSAGACGAGRQG